MYACNRVNRQNSTMKREITDIHALNTFREGTVLLIEGRKGQSYKSEVSALSSKV